MKQNIHRLILSLIFITLTFAGYWLKSYHTDLQTFQHTTYIVPPQSWVRNNVKEVLEYQGIKRYSATNRWDKTGYRIKQISYYLPNISVIFTGVPKTGCSNMVGALLNAEGAIHLDRIKPGRISKVHNPGVSLPYRLTSVKNDLMLLENIASFTVTRNPWVRLVSGYRDKLSSEKNHVRGFRQKQAQIVAWARNMTIEDVMWRKKRLYPTFNEFLDYLIKNEAHGNDHFNLQFNSLGLEHVDYTYVAALELLNYQFSEIEALINIKMSIYGSYDKSHDTKNTTSVLLAKKWFKMVEPVKIEKLYNIFKPDFLLYNYSNFTHEDFPLPVYPV